MANEKDNKQLSPSSKFCMTVLQSIQNIQMTSILDRQIASILTNRGTISLCHHHVQVIVLEMPKLLSSYT